MLDSSAQVDLPYDSLKSDVPQSEMPSEVSALLSVNQLSIRARIRATLALKTALRG